MAKTDDRDETFFREVDDEYRRSQIASAWSRYGVAGITLLVVLLLAFGGYLWWRADSARRAGVTGEEFSQALTRLEGGNTAAATPVIDDLARTGNPGYSALARLMQAATAVQRGETAKATAIFKAIAADEDAAKPFRDLATIKATRLEFETLPPATVIARLKALSVPGDPWFGLAAEMTGIAQMRAGKPELAAPLFAAIARDATAAPSLRARAAQLAVSLGVDPATLAPAAPLSVPGNTK